jgi:hypothetical protein
MSLEGAIIFAALVGYSGTSVAMLGPNLIFHLKSLARNLEAGSYLTCWYTHRAMHAVWKTWTLTLTYLPATANRSQCKRCSAYFASDHDDSMQKTLNCLSQCHTCTTVTYRTQLKNCRHMRPWFGDNWAYALTQ